MAAFKIKTRKAFFLTLLFIICLSASSISQTILTGCEKSGYASYTTYEEMLDFLQQIDTFSTEIVYDTYGTTRENRELPFAVFSRPLISNPENAVNSGKTVVVLAANIHGNEKSLRESNMVLIRELSTPGTAMNALLDSLVIIMVPSINPDGFVSNTRGNSLGVDMNRDYMKLEHKSLVNYVSNIIQKWKPHIVVDGHNGGSYPYNICYLAPSNASCDQRLTLLADQEIFPFINEKMEADGYKSWYYTRGNSTQWTIGSSGPRIGRNYGGFINSLTILFETPGGYSIETDVKSGVVAYKAVLQYAAQNSDSLIMYVERAKTETIEMGETPYGEIPLDQEYVAEDYPVSYEIYVGGQIVQITGAQIIKKPVVTKSRPRPYAYLLGSDAQQAVDLLNRHTIIIERLLDETIIDVEGYTLTGIVRGKLYDHQNAAIKVNVEDSTVKMTKTFSQDTYVIKTGQALGRVVSHLLEPESDDNVITWNTMDNLLPDPAGADPVIPIYKLMTPTALPTEEYVSGIDPEPPIVQETFILYKNYPNPFNSSTAIEFTIPKTSDVKLTIYDILGREVKALANSEFPAGSHLITWDSQNAYGIPVASGVYIYRMVAGNVVQTRKMLLLR